MPESAGIAIAIVIVDDHALFRESIGRLLAAEPGFTVLAHCGTLAEGLDALAGRQVDVVLLDFDLGDDDGREFIRRARERNLSARILVVTAGIGGTAAAELIRMGVVGVFPKQESARLLVQAIRDVSAGKSWFQQTQLASALQAVSPARETAAAPAFTAREKKVLEGVFEGLANKEIAASLAVSESSVKATLQQLFAKTGVRTRGQLVRIALERFKDEL